MTKRKRGVKKYKRNGFVDKSYSSAILSTVWMKSEEAMGYQVLCLSGAGLSAESGIRTFRDSGGLWEEFDIMEVCSAEGFRRDRQKVLEFYDRRRADLADKVPNCAHEEIARIKKAYPHEIAVVTQNVDDLLERAGCPEVIHLHGTLRDLRCEDCNTVWDIGYESIRGKRCPRCASAQVRHNVVMFHEEAPAYRLLYRLIDETRDGLFVAIGTSGQVIDVAGIACCFTYSILNNLHPNTAIDPFFSLVFHEKATTAVPKIMTYVARYMETGRLLCGE